MLLLHFPSSKNSVFTTILTLVIFCSLFLTYLLCGKKGKKGKKNKKIKSEHDMQLYDNLDPLNKPIEVKEDKEKEEDIRKGRLNKKIRDPQYDTMRDLNKLDELEKTAAKSELANEGEEAEVNEIEEEPEEEKPKPKPKPKKQTKRAPVKVEPTSPPAENDKEDEEQPPPSSKKKTPARQKKTKTAPKSQPSTPQDDEDAVSPKRKPRPSMNDIAARDRKEVALWDVKEDEDKKKRIQHGLIAAPKDPNYQTLNLDELDFDDELKEKDLKPKSTNNGDNIEKKVKKIRDGAVVNPRDPLYDTFKGDMLLPELENDPVLPHKP